MMKNEKTVGQLLDEFTNEPTNNNTDEENTACRGDRKHCLVTYIDPLSLRGFLNTANWVQHWALITHDKDVTADGKPKEPHTHIVLYTINAKTASAVLKLFDRLSISIYGKEKKQNTFHEYCLDVGVSYRYLIHADDPQKYQYDSSLRFVDDIGYWSKFETGRIDKPNIGVSMVNDLLSGVPYRMMAEKYGRDFIYHAKYVEDYARRIRLEECVTNSPVDDELIKAVLDSSPFGVLEIDSFFNMIAYLREAFGNCYNNTQGFEIYLKKLGLE